MKLLETSLSGYVSKSDMPRAEAQAKFESWSQLVTPPALVDESAVTEVRAESSGFDGVLILNTPEAECARRSQNRKIDPTTQIVYHMESNPPEDSKIIERLQDYTDEAGNSERMQKITTSFQQSIVAIKQWLTRFGLSSLDGICQVQLDMEVTLQQPAALPAAEGEDEPKQPEDPWRQKDAVFDAVYAHVEKICSFRQS